MGLYRGFVTRVYRDHTLPTPKLFLESYQNTTHCFIVSFSDYEEFVYALSQWAYESETHKVIAARDVEKGKLYYINEVGDVLRYTLNDFIYELQED